MIALVAGVTEAMLRYAHTGLFGQLFLPAARNREDFGLPWACDNGAYSGFDETAFLKMLDRFDGRPGCWWVAAPDVVGNACATLILFYHWEPLIRARGYPVALVAQDGLEVATTPWQRMDALFVGGSTEWKLGPTARRLMREAKARGLRVHVGRVNTAPRVRYLQELGVVDSIDGSKLSMWPDVWFPQFVNLLGNPQLSLLGGE